MSGYEGGGVVPIRQSCFVTVLLVTVVNSDLSDHRCDAHPGCRKAGR